MKMINELSPVSKSLFKDESSTIFFNKSENFYLLIEGEIIIRSSENRRVIARLSAPFIIGIHIFEDAYLQTISTAILKYFVSN